VTRHLNARGLAFAATLACLVLPAGASAARPLRTGVLATAPFTGADATLAFARARAAGMTSIRLQLSWREVAPGGTAKPPGFDASNHTDPRYRWANIDRQVRLAVAHGLEPLVNVVTAPFWAQGEGRGTAGSIRPSPTELGLFASAAATRYNGRVRGLPRVRHWQVWSEPNHFLFFVPQNEGGRSFSPGHYRQMVNQFADAVHEVSSRNLVVAGGLAPFGNPEPDRFVTPPLVFMRRLLCMSGGRRPRPTCRGRTRFDVWTHHPYTAGGPTHRARLRNDVSLGDLGRMRRLLTAAARANHVVTRRPVRFWATEFSWDTNPPDSGGVPLGLHARWVSEALYRMWRARISLVTWFLLHDDAAAGRPDPSVFQSGLYFRCAGGLRCDRPKPALAAFRFPFVAFRSRARRVLVWGRTPRGRRARVIVEQRRGGRWRRVRRVRTNRHGIFSRRVRSAGRGPFRARIRSGASSRAFSLKRPPDRPVNPFG
jgi:hypothetical protein